MGHFNLSRQIIALVVAVMATVAVVGPVAAVAIGVLTDSQWTWPNIVGVIVPSGRRLILLLKSALLSLLSAAACVLLSWFIGSFLWQMSRRYPIVIRYAAVFIWFMALMPSFVHSYTWMAVLGDDRGFSGMTASWWTQTMAWLPLCLSAALLGFRFLNPELIAAAQLVATPLRVLTGIITPLLAPALLAGGALVFLMCLQEYSIPSLFQVSTYSLEIFSDYSAHNQPVRALLLSVPVMAISCVALVGAKPWFRHVTVTAPRGGQMGIAEFRLPLLFRLIQYGCLLLMGMQIFLPLWLLIRTAGSGNKLVASVLASAPEILFSIQTAFLSAIISVGMAAVIISMMTAACQTALIPLTAVSLCVPATLTGIGMIVLYNDWLLSWLYHTEWMPVATAVARFGPLAWLIVAAQNRRHDYRLIEAARLYQVSSWQLWTRIRLPLMLPGMIVAGMTVFLLTMGELSATLLVLPPGRNTLAVKTYNLLHYGASDAVAGLCLFLVVTGWLAGMAAITALAIRRR